MKTLKVKKVIDDQTTNLDLVRICVNTIVPPKGITVDEMRIRMRILDVIAGYNENENPEVNLEDADFALLKRLVAQQEWAIINKDILAFSDEIKSL